MAVPLAAWIRDKLALSVVSTLRRQLLIRVWKMEIGEGSIISRSAKLDKTNPRGIHIGKYTVVAFGAAILTHDWVNNRDRDVYIGDNCFIGAHAIILAGVTIGDNCIVSAQLASSPAMCPRARSWLETPRESSRATSKPRTMVFAVRERIDTGEE